MCSRANRKRADLPLKAPYIHYEELPSSITTTPAYPTSELSPLSPSETLTNTGTMSGILGGVYKYAPGQWPRVRPQ
jgi:hypothetical protein